MRGVGAWFLVADLITPRAVQLDVEACVRGKGHAGIEVMDPGTRQLAKLALVQKPRITLRDNTHVVCNLGYTGAAP